MATWDGSYPFAEDPNYYLYSEQSIPGPSSGNAPFFLVNANDGYSQGEPVFGQSCPFPYHQNVDGNVSAVSSNLVPLQDCYREQRFIPGTIKDSRMAATREYTPDPFEHNRCYPIANQHCNATYDPRTRRPENLNKRMFFRNTGNIKSNIAERSNLQATANEFVPNESRQKHAGRTVNISSNIAPSNGQETSTQNSQSVRSVFSELVNGQYEVNKKYKNRGNVNYNQSRGGQFQKRSIYKNAYRQQTNDLTKYENITYTSNIQTEKTEASVSNVYSSRSTHMHSDNTATTRQNTAAEYEQAADNLEKNNGLVCSNEEEIAKNKGDVRQVSKLRKYGNRTKEFSCWNSSLRQYQAKPTRRFVRDTENQDKYENGHKEKKQSYQRYNGIKDDLPKNIKSESGREKDKDKDGSKKVIDNWRSKKNNNDKSIESKRISNKKHTFGMDDDANQRERLTDQLNKGQLECLVCCEHIKQTDYVWSCSNCYHVLHLKCVKKWAKSSQAENGWRCPACQNTNVSIPKDYFCFCGKMRIPEWNRRDAAHSCGDVCGRTLSKNNCVHKCTLLCHPGSCPLCTAMVTRHCGCERTSQTVQCSTQTLLVCDSICNKDLNCGRHKCEKKCHHGDCGSCEAMIEQECYCKKSKRNVVCGENISLMYSCDDTCGKELNCGNHICKKLCHPNECEPCSLTPDKVVACCCGQTPLEKKRESCLDPVPTCGKICAKILRCGQLSNPHVCKITCHEGECPDCDMATGVKCRCGNTDTDIPCKDLRQRAKDIRCERRCTKKRSCGKHVCNQLCCIDIDHVCPLPCSKTLSCGRHKCEQSCHKGRCQPCWRSSFEELYCECGAAVILPPVPCGTRRPACNRPCSREHSCEHEALHNCHSEPNCPPCTVLTQRWCYGKHELRKAVPCHIQEISCGLPCNKPLSCGRHKCVTICHPGPCEKSGQQCSQPCANPRETCGHMCAAQCHESKCPDTPCKEIVKVTCQCGHRSTSRVCEENAKEYQRIASSILASKMVDMQFGHSIDLDEIFGQGAKKQNQLKTLECNDECKLIERNRKLALGLQIVNPDLSGKLMPRYSDFMKQWAKKDPRFCQMVHEKLTELVQLAKTSKQKSRSYSFDSMNRDKRHFVHESCEHFGCESQAYDQEPKRNIVATAVKDKCWLPSYSLLEIVQRENGQRKIPGPMLSTSKTEGSAKAASSSLPVKKIPKTVTSPKLPSESEVDYFDYRG